MVALIITLLIVAFIAGVLGFGMVAGTAAFIAKVLFFVFLVALVISLITGGRAAPPA